MYEEMTFNENYFEWHGWRLCLKEAWKFQYYLSRLGFNRQKSKPLHHRKFHQKKTIFKVEREQTEQPSVGLKQISIKMRQLGTANDPCLHFIGPLFQAQLDIDQKSKVVRKGKRGGGKKFHTTCLWFREHHSSRKYAHVFHPSAKFSARKTLLYLEKAEKRRKTGHTCVVLPSIEHPLATSRC